MNDLEVFPPSSEAMTRFTSSTSGSRTKTLVFAQASNFIHVFQLFRGSLLQDSISLLILFFQGVQVNHVPRAFYIFIPSTILIYIYMYINLYLFACDFSRKVFNVVSGSHLQFLCDYPA